MFLHSYFIKFSNCPLSLAWLFCFQKQMLISYFHSTAALDSNLNEFSTPIPSNPPTTENCTDTIDNCDDYGADVCLDYRPWATAHCPLHCGFCRGGSTSLLTLD